METNNKHTREPSGYEVTANGRVFSVSHNWRGYGKRELSQQPNSHGYSTVRLVVNGIRKKFFVHKLVASKYLPERPSPSHEIRHLNGIRTDNRSVNLTWGTRKDNAADRERHGRTSRGRKHSDAIRASNHAAAVRAYRRRKGECHV